MPKYYCDYCDIFLTHDSVSVRKAHNTGWKHINQVVAYYREVDGDKMQEVANRIAEAYAEHNLPVPQQVRTMPMEPDPFYQPPGHRGGRRGGGPQRRGGGGRFGGGRDGGGGGRNGGRREFQGSRDSSRPSSNSRPYDGRPPSSGRYGDSSGMPSRRDYPPPPSSSQYMR